MTRVAKRDVTGCKGGIVHGCERECVIFIKIKKNQKSKKIYIFYFLFLCVKVGRNWRWGVHLLGQSCFGSRLKRDYKYFFFFLVFQFFGWTSGQKWTNLGLGWFYVTYVQLFLNHAIRNIISSYFVSFGPSSGVKLLDEGNYTLTTSIHRY